jgi:hypothetical protein
MLKYLTVEQVEQVRLSLRYHQPYLTPFPVSSRWVRKRIQSYMVFGLAAAVDTSRFLHF